MILSSGQIGNTESELKKLAEENPDLQEAYIAKQKRLQVSKPGCPQLTSAVCIKCSTFCTVSLCFRTSSIKYRKSPEHMLPLAYALLLERIFLY